MYLISGLANSVAELCTSNLLIQLINRCRIKKIEKVLNVYMVFLMNFEIGILYYLILQNTDVKHNFPLIIVAVGFLILDIGILYLFKTVSIKMMLEQKSILLEQQMSLTIKYYESLQERYDQIQKILHDVKKHIRVMEDVGKYKHSLKIDYGEELIESIESSEQFFYCSDPIVGVIIWDKMQICRHYDISFDVNIQDILFDFMEKTEVTILFVNLLDNAIEACQRMKKKSKQIELRIHLYKHYVVIRMKNSIEYAPKINKGMLISSKVNHLGMGITILSDLANKYCGNLNYDYTNEYFVTKMILSTTNKM